MLTHIHGPSGNQTHNPTVEARPPEKGHTLKLCGHWNQQAYLSKHPDLPGVMLCFWESSSQWCEGKQCLHIRPLLDPFRWEHYVLQSDGNHSPNDRASHLSGPETSKTLRWEPQISHCYMQWTRKMPYLSINDFASSTDVKAPHLAVGIACLSINILAHCLSASIRAACLPGPKQFTPLACKTSAIPLAKGSSGPTTTRSTLFSLLHAATA